MNVVLRMSRFERTGEEAATRAATDITDICSRLNVAIFDGDGTKVKSIAQKEGDSSFGTVALSLPEATYKLVVMAHNCTHMGTGVM